MAEFANWAHVVIGIGGDHPDSGRIPQTRIQLLSLTFAPRNLRNEVGLTTLRIVRTCQWCLPRRALLTQCDLVVSRHFIRLQ